MHGEAGRVHSATTLNADRVHLAFLNASIFLARLRILVLIFGTI